MLQYQKGQLSLQRQHVTALFLPTQAQKGQLSLQRQHVTALFLPTQARALLRGPCKLPLKKPNQKGGEKSKANPTKKMEEEMEVMMMTPTATMTKSTEKSRNPMAGPTDPPSSPIWKLYDNPHYADRVHRHHHHHSYACITKSRSSYHTRDLGSFSRPMNRDVNLSDLDNALAEIKELRAELEFERRMRRKVDALNRALARELEEERRSREAAEGTGRRMAEEIGRVREDAERAMKEVEDERRMLRMAEAMREERVQMKLSEAKFVMEEKIKEMMPIVDPKKNQNQSQNEERKEIENPHIKRAIKGMEFPKAVRVRSSSSPGSREGRGGHQLGSNLECQRAQLRVLMRHKNPAGTGIIGAAENLVM